ncbi:hypothetical protein [Rhodoligotrophos defluvii]|uniref:hypothetical protein n=1 Tax=Rhodoligotrophos defluvii TaxID=2561934 RepID=UPI0010C95D27|nr:hypothetical protein [Rhodoligotrophos defluvii]
MSRSPGSSIGLPIGSGTFRALAWLGVLLQAIAFVAVLWLQRWNGAWAIAAFFVVSLTFLLIQDRLPGLLKLLVILAAILNALGWSFDYFNRVVWYDEVVHVFSSLAVMSAIGHLGWTRGVIGGAPQSFTFICTIVAIGFGLGVAWEIIEMIFLNLRVGDTIVDLVLDVLGAAGGALLAGWVIGRQQRLGLDAGRLRGSER